VKEVKGKSKKETGLNSRKDVKAEAANKSTKKNKSVRLKETVKKKGIKNKAAIDILENAKKKFFPASFKPMLATLVDKPFDEEGWLYEIKWDGYRAIGMMNKGKVALLSRNHKSFNEKFYPVTKALKLWNINAVVDGEIVVVNDNGISNFAALQNWRSEADGELYYYVFDITWLDGKDLTAMPLRERKEILASQIPEHSIIKSSQVFEVSGTRFFEAAKKMGLEGIIAKKANSIYHQGKRTQEWLKIKVSKRQEMVIGGFTKNDDSSKLFSALLVGVFDKGKLQYTGKIGTGFNDKMQREMLKQFKPLIIKKTPFDELPEINKPSRFRPNPPNAVAKWLKPELVCEVSFAEMTTDGLMRHPSFEGMRTDKKARQVIMEKAISTKKAMKTPTNTRRKTLNQPVKKNENHC
jgi:bifunctional non-homologous end joining protein LigD